ncbi:MAG: putative porin [Pseudobacteriovorax sp.]|nr:putative porin [Pseudobacteriovorax sp.]
MKHLLSLGILSIGLSTGSAFAEVKISGDMRYRIEQFDLEDEDYIRTRIRARVKLASDINEQFKVGLRLATGGGSATSTNQTLGDGFGNKGFEIDQAFLKYLPTSDLEIGLGKVKNPVYKPGKSELVFDGDLTPEGVYGVYETKLGSFSLRPLLASFTLYENKKKTDQELGIVQLKLGYKLNETVSFTFGGSIYKFSNIKGLVLSDTEGNSVDESSEEASPFLENYNLTEAFLEGIFTVGGQPLTVFAQSVSNSEVDEDNQALTYGISYGKGKGEQPWAVALWARTVEKDAVFSPISDSDFGSGDTDEEGYVIQVKYALFDNVALSVRHLTSEGPIEPAAGEEAEAFKLTQVNIQVKF